MRFAVLGFLLIIELSALAANYVRGSEIKDGAASLKTANSLVQVCAVIDYVLFPIIVYVAHIYANTARLREGGTHRTKEKNPITCWEILISDGRFE